MDKIRDELRVTCRHCDRLFRRLEISEEFTNIRYQCKGCHKWTSVAFALDVTALAKVPEDIEEHNVRVASSSKDTET